MLDKVINDVMKFDDYHGLMEENEPQYDNLFHMALCLSGEAGEFANEVKKIWRDGDSQELRDNMATELVDILIYIAKLIVILDIDIEKYWNEKHEELYERWADRDLSCRKIQLIVKEE